MQILFILDLSIKVQNTFTYYSTLCRIKLLLHNHFLNFIIRKRIIKIFYEIELQCREI